ncbi:MAG: hypothetical protein NC548_33275 [Lachnospiraceae bacterium]|nr:hypothetical protein [Lachnospiraceae bacterium]
MKKNKMMQMLAVCVMMAMVLVSAVGCGNNSEEALSEMVSPATSVAQAAESAAETADVTETMPETEENTPDAAEEETGEVEVVELIPYAEENGLEFCEELTVPTQGVRTNINDDTDKELADAEWTIKNISIEDGEDGKQVITIESECRSSYRSDRKGRDMFRLTVPSARYCDLNTGECFPSATKTGDMSLGYIVEVEWDGVTYEIDVTGNSDWDDSGDWAADENGEYIHPSKVYCTESLVVTSGYNSLGMIIEPSTFADVEDRADGVQEEAAFIKDILDEREGSYLFSIMDIYNMLNGGSGEDADTSVEGGKGNATDNESSKENTTTDNSSSKDNTTPKQEQPVHTHSYTSGVTKNPSCGENGVMTYTCACGSSYTEAIPASGHQWTTTTETISHPSTGHYETVTKKELWCGCGASGFQSQAELDAHWATAKCGSFGAGVDKWEENVWIVDSEEWTETINVTRCAVCGVQG